MFNWRGLGKAVLGVVLFSPGGLPAGGTVTVPKQDRAWKQYRNTRWGYCVDYPARWMKGDAYEGAGLFVRTGVTRLSASPSGEIDVSVQEQPSSAQRATSMDLTDSLQFHRESVVRFQRAQQMKIMETRRMTFADYPAIFTKDQYFDPLERTFWIEELIFASRGGQLYRLELVCRAKDAERFERVFQHVVDSFRFTAITPKLDLIQQEQK